LRISLAPLILVGAINPKERRILPSESMLLAQAI